MKSEADIKALSGKVAANFKNGSVASHPLFRHKLTVGVPYFRSVY